MGRAEQKELTRQAILDVARSHFEEYGFEATKIREIARKAGVANGTVVLHFPTKEDLLHASLYEALENAIDHALKSVPQAALSEQLTHITASMFDFYAQRPELSRVLLKESLFAQPPWAEKFTGQVARVHRRIAALARDAVARGELAEDVSTDLLGAAYFSFYYFGLIAWVQNAHPDPVGMVNRLIEQHIAGLAPNQKATKSLPTETEMPSLFKNEQSKALLLDWYDRFHNKINATTSAITTTTSYGETHVLIAGPQDGPSIVVLHGALATSAHILRELEYLTSTYRVYAVDVLGQSVKSADTQMDVNSDDYGLWLAEVLDALAIEKTKIIGVSWGGFVAAKLASVAPERVEKLALLVPAGIVKTPFWNGFVKVGVPMTRFLMRPTDKHRDKFMEQLLTTPDDDWAAYMGDAFRSYNMRLMQVPPTANIDDYANYKNPTLVVAADNDLNFPGEPLLERASELFKNLAETELLKDCHHCPPTTDDFRQWMASRLTQFFEASAN